MLRTSLAVLIVTIVALAVAPDASGQTLPQCPILRAASPIVATKSANPA